jgi:hypothetical protein
MISVIQVRKKNMKVKKKEHEGHTDICIQSCGKYNENKMDNKDAISYQLRFFGHTPSPNLEAVYNM